MHGKTTSAYPPGESRMSAADWFRAARIRGRAYPYSWRCAAPDPATPGEECGTFSFAATREQAEAAHRTHYQHNHTR
ncbi:hypothetical protein [Nocardiopsis sp. LOL_012]|uniref:hypothetical protein n=1 Tax=Nocardiopsis sp. LOL_012 TaxID=3345409 RepID=UPI003A885AAE